MFGLIKSVMVIAIFLIINCKKISEQSVNVFTAQNDNQIDCVTNSSSALFWTTAIEEIPIISTFIPSSSGIFDCNFDYGSKCSESWKNGRWVLSEKFYLTPEIVDFVMDRRWEKMLINYSNNYYNVIFQSNNEQQSITFINFSVRTRCGGYLFICENQFNYFPIICYEIFLQHCRTGQSTLTKCYFDKIIEYPQTNYRCQEETKNLLMSFRLEEIFDKNDWKHFKITTTEGFLKLIQVAENEESLIFTQKNELESIFSRTPFRIYFGSESPTLWKFQQLNYLFATRPRASFTILGPEIDVNNNTLCISLFVSMCQSCKLLFRITDNDNFEQEYQFQIGDGLWHEITLKAEDIRAKKVFLKVSTVIVEKTTKDPYWAIDDVRMCQEQEFRVLELPKTNNSSNLECKLLLPEKKSQMIQNYKKKSESTLCSENSLSKLCVPCQWLYGTKECSQVQICEGVTKAATKCFDSKPSTVNESYNHYIIILLLSVLIILITTITIVFICKKRCASESISDGNFLNSAGNSNRTAPVTNTSLVRFMKFPIVKPPGQINIDSVPVKEFEQYVQTLLENEESQTQLKFIPEPLYCEISEATCASPANPDYEYPNVYQVDSYETKNAFTIIRDSKTIGAAEFWKIIWRDNISTTVWLSFDNESEDNQKFYPNTESSLEIGEVIVELVPNERILNYEYREYIVHRRNKQRKVSQIRFNSCIDHLPLLSQDLATLSKRLLKVSLTTKTPILIRSSADVTLVGAIVLADTCLRMAAREGFINVKKNFVKLRCQIPTLVDDVTFFKLMHLVILESLNSINDGIPCHELKFCDKDFIRLQINWINNPKINFLETENEDGNQEVFVNCFRTPKKFLLKLEPKVGNVDDFWRRVVIEEISLIVFCRNLKIEILWPKNHFSSITTPLGAVTLRLVNSEVLETHTLVTLNATLTGQKNNVTVEIIIFSSWQSCQLLPKRLQDFVIFCEKTSVLCRKSNPVLVIYSDDATACGVFLGFLYVMEKMKLENSCDVPKAVDNVRQINSKFLRNEVQIQFLYQAAKKYLEGFEMYSNFK